MREVRLRQRAQHDLESLYIYIAYDSAMPQAAQNLVDALFEAFERVAELPESGMLFASDDLDREYRRILVKSHWVYYTYDEKALTIWRIFHTRQDIDTYTVIDLLYGSIGSKSFVAPDDPPPDDDAEFENMFS